MAEGTALLRQAVADLVGMAGRRDGQVVHDCSELGTRIAEGLMVEHQHAFDQRAAIVLAHEQGLLHFLNQPLSKVFSDCKKKLLQ